VEDEKLWTSHVVVHSFFSSFPSLSRKKRKRERNKWSADLPAGKGTMTDVRGETHCPFLRQKNEKKRGEEQEQKQNSIETTLLM
jgi:hypothetical protein